MLGLAVKLCEFPLSVVCVVAVNGLFRRSVPVCALLAQTQCLHF